MELKQVVQCLCTSGCPDCKMEGISFGRVVAQYRVHNKAQSLLALVFTSSLYYWQNNIHVKSGALARHRKDREKRVEDKQTICF